MTDVQQKIQEFLAARTPVYLYHNDEAGPLWWSVCVGHDPEFWLGSFEQLEDAQTYCRNHGLPLTGVSEVCQSRR